MSFLKIRSLWKNTAQLIQIEAEFILDLIKIIFLHLDALFLIDKHFHFEYRQTSSMDFNIIPEK